MAYSRTHLTAATSAVTNQFVTSTNMIVGAYALANAGAMPSAGARHVTLVRTVAGNADTPGTIVVVGKDLNGDTITETLIPGATGVTVTGALWFASITSVTGVGWVIDPGTTTNDTIIVGCAAGVAAVHGTGTLWAVVVNATAAGAITLSDSAGTIAVLKASIAEGTYIWNVAFSGFLGVALAASSDVTVVHSGSLPSAYAMS